MKDTMTQKIPTGLLLKNLMENLNTKILDREIHNHAFIHFYNIGDYWVAFEQSACRMDGIFSQCQLSLFMIPGRSAYVVMGAITNDEAVAYFRRHIAYCDEPYYKVLTARPFPAGYYRMWHVEVVKWMLEGFSGKGKNKYQLMKITPR